MVEETTQVRSPFIVGVSGHRNLHLEAEGALYEQTIRFLEDLKRRMPDTELRLMVGMAQGADLLAARAALAAGYIVDAALPMPLDEYLKDFNTDSKAALESLISNPAVRCTVLTDPVDHVVSSAEGRNGLYTNLGAALIRNANVLLALWNGEASPLPGGTADTVLRYLGSRTQNTAEQRQLEVVAADSEHASGLQVVYWIPARRSDDATPPSHGPCFLSGLGENLLASYNVMPEPLEAAMADLNAYNVEFERLRKNDNSLRLDSLMSDLGALSSHVDRESLERIDCEYGKADALAIFHQRRSNRVFRWFSYMAILMALLFLVYAKLWASNVLLSLYLAILLTGFLSYYLVRDKHWLSKHLLYRALAETLRTRFYLRAAGADRLVNSTELIELTGVSHFAGFAWMINLMKTVQPMHARGAMSATDEQRRLQSVHRSWIQGQQTYLSKRVRKLEREQHRLERSKSILLYTIVTLAAVLLLFAVPLSAYVVGSISLKNGLVFLMGLLPVSLGVWELYQHKMATRELLWQYRNQLGCFTRADQQLSRTKVPDRCRAILAQTGKESLMESYLWTIHRFHREYEPPSAG